MNIIYILIGAGMGFALGRITCRHSSGQMKQVGEINAEAGEKKKIAKEKIMEFISSSSSVTNNDIQKLLGISDATATNYLSELEAEGKITQLGDTGRGVTYKLNG